MSRFDPQLLLAWQNFFVVIGSAAAALISVQFVVVTLLASIRRPTNIEGVDAFGTPTVVHFSGALTIAAIMLVPWTHRAPPATVLAIGGLLGLGYCAVVYRRTLRQEHYRPDAEDWFWYVIAPTILHCLLAGSAVVLLARDFGILPIGADSLALLLLGVRNAWDSLTHIATDQDAGK